MGIDGNSLFYAVVLAMTVACLPLLILLSGKKVSKIHKDTEPLIKDLNWKLLSPSLHSYENVFLTYGVKPPRLKNIDSHYAMNHIHKSLRGFIKKNKVNMTVQDLSFRIIAMNDNDTPGIWSDRHDSGGKWFTLSQVVELSVRGISVERVKAMRFRDARYEEILATSGLPEEWVTRLYA